MWEDSTTREVTPDNTSWTTGVTPGPSYHPLIGDDVRRWFEIGFYIIINGSISLIGAFANLINIMVFVKQGFSDSINISLLCLSVSDLGSLLLLIVQGIFLSPIFVNSDIPIAGDEVHFLFGAIPHGMCVRYAWWITTFITFERCLCVALPLKIKHIITPLTTVVTMAVIVLVNTAGMSLLLDSYTLDWRFSEARNATVLGLSYPSYGAALIYINSQFNTVTQFLAFFINFLCTAVIVTLLKMKSRWRLKTSNASRPGSAGELTTRDKKLVKMVALISVIFIVCLMPSCFNFIMEFFYGHVYSFAGVERNLYYIVWSWMLTLEAINSTVNIFVYYTMSSKFKATFDRLLFRNKRQQRKHK